MYQPEIRLCGLRFRIAAQRKFVRLFKITYYNSIELYLRCTVKNCKICRYSKVCNDLPGICLLLQHTAVALVIGGLGYLFVTQEILN